MQLSLSLARLVFGCSKPFPFNILRAGSSHTAYFTSRDGPSVRTDQHPVPLKSTNDESYPTLDRFQIKVIKDLSKKISGLVGGALGSGTLADCIITGTLTFYLQTNKSGYNT